MRDHRPARHSLSHGTPPLWPPTSTTSPSTTGPLHVRSLRYRRRSLQTVLSSDRLCRTFGDSIPPRSIPPSHSLSLLIPFPASRLRAWHPCTTQPSRGRSACPATRTRRLPQGSQRLQGANSGVGRRCEPVEGRGASRTLPRAPSPISISILTVPPHRSLQADSALLVVKIAHSHHRSFFWEFSSRLTDF